MLRKNQQDEEKSNRCSKLQQVFSKLSGVLPKTPPDLGSPKTMASDIIESVFVDTTTSTVSTPSSYQSDLGTTSTDDLCITVSTLADRLETELRAAKTTHLSCGEVLLPCGFLHMIARDIINMSESEPYGTKGCLVHICFKGINEVVKLSSFKCDPGTATTFSIRVTVRQQCSITWHILPQILKNFGRGGTVVLAPTYGLHKRKLYRSNLD